MHNKKKIPLILFTVFVIVLSIFFFQNNSVGKFVGQKSEFIVNGSSMQPMFSHGEVVNVVDDYYKNNTVERGDIVLFKHSANENLLIKVVKATDKDFLEIKDKNLLINGDVMKNSVGQIYIFQPNEIKMLGLYIEDGYLPKDTVFVFGDNITDSKDSRNFGAVPKSYIISLIKQK